MPVHTAPRKPGIRRMPSTERLEHFGSLPLEKLATPRSSGVASLSERRGPTAPEGPLSLSRLLVVSGVVDGPDLHAAYTHNRGWTEDHHQAAENWTGRRGYSGRVHAPRPRPLWKAKPRFDWKWDFPAGEGHEPSRYTGLSRRIGMLSPRQKPSSKAAIRPLHFEERVQQNADIHLMRHSYTSGAQTHRPSAQVGASNINFTSHAQTGRRQTAGVDGMIGSSCTSPRFGTSRQHLAVSKMAAIEQDDATAMGLATTEEHAKMTLAENVAVLEQRVVPESSFRESTLSHSMKLDLSVTNTSPLHVIMTKHRTPIPDNHHLLALKQVSTICVWAASRMRGVLRPWACAWPATLIVVSMQNECCGDVKCICRTDAICSVIGGTRRQVP